MKSQQCEYSHLYKPAKKWEVVNDNDPDLHPIYFSLPTPPPLHLIDGWGRHPDDQYFRRMEVPRKLRELEDVALNDLYEVEKGNRQETIQGYKLYLKYWELIDQRSDELEKEIEWLKKVWWHRTYGYWCFIDGEPTFIPPEYWDFLNFYYIAESKVYPEFRYDILRKSCFIYYLMHATETFSDIDPQTGLAIKKDGKYRMLDLGRRVFLGDIEPKTRRVGATHEGIHNVLFGTMTHESFYSTIISLEGQNAKALYEQKLLPAWDNYPMCLKPIWEGNRRPSVLKLSAPPNIYHIKGLNSAVSFTEGAGEKKSEGKRLNRILADEQGKCFGKGTQILLFNGSVKNVEDIIEGDLLMGDDNKPRKVLSLARGVDEMYEIIPNKGEPWVCNSQHILTVKVCDEPRSDRCYKMGDIIDITLDYYLSLKPYERKALCLKKIAVEYPAQKHKLPPYLLGVWLGDGSHGDSCITNIDKEICDYMGDYCRENNLIQKNIKITRHYRGANGKKVVEYNNGKQVAEYSSISATAEHYGRSHVWVKINSEKNGRDRFRIIERRNVFLDGLKHYNLVKNKHIPNEYMIDSLENRLSLLAGIIDTDGNAHTPPKHGYEITQKRQKLAKSIFDLARSCGFYSSIRPKTARMKRQDGSVYECRVYRVMIFGNDLYRIPCLVNRKRYEKWELHKNTRDSSVTGFKIESIGMGDYYGFVIDGNRRFLLADYTIVHNTQAANVAERHHVNKLCMTTGMGVNIIESAYCKNPSTVEEMDDGGAAYYKIAMLSDFYRRIPSLGQTYEGLARIFLPAYLRLEGYIDRFGVSVVNEPTERQKRLSPNSIFALSNKGARQMLQEQRDALLREGTPQALEAYRSLRRKSPFNWAECWLGSSGDVGFNMEIIDARIAEINRLKSLSKPPYRVGNFHREGGHPDGKVLWRDDMEKGKFELSFWLPAELANQRTQCDYYDPIKGVVKPAWKPVNGHRFTLGADPFRSIKKNEAKEGMKITGHTSTSRQSDGGIGINWEYDSAVDAGKSRKDWESDRLVCAYRARPATQEEYFEDILMAAQYFGAMIYPEYNVERVVSYIIERGYWGYLLFDIDMMTGRPKAMPGRYTTNESLQEMISECKDYIEFRGEKECHDKFLIECKNLRGTESITHSDLWTAYMLARLGSKSRHREIISNVSNKASLDLQGIGIFRKRVI